MKSYFKFLSRNKLYTAIEAAGLIVSLAFVIIIATSIRDQLGIVKNVPDHENLYLVGSVDGGAAGEYRMSERLNTLPEIDHLSAFVVRKSLLQVNGENHYQKIGLMDVSLLDLIPLEVRSGSNPPFSGGEGVAITERAARRFFPGRDPVGETVGFLESPMDDEPVPATITAVIDNPDFTILGDFDFAVDLQSHACQIATEVRESDLMRRGMGSMVYFLTHLGEGVQLDTLSKRIASFSPWLNQNAGRLLVPYDEVFFSPNSFSGFRQGKRLYFTILVILVLLLLLSAILTYINLSFAVTGNRAKEMATRRLVGEDRSGIFWRVLGESLVFTSVCYVLAILLSFWLAPVLDSLRPTGFSIPFRLCLDLPFWLMSAGLVLIVGLLAGTVPAAACAAFRPLDVVSGEVRRKRKMSLGRICIIIQSVMAMVLIVMTITLSRQLRFLEKADIGADMQEDLYFFETPLSDPDFVLVLSDMLRSSPLVREIGYTTGYPTYIRSITSGKGANLAIIRCDSTAFGMMGFRIKERFAQVSGSVMLSESAANALGITRENATPQNVFYGYERNPDPRLYPPSVGGVLEDFRMSPVNVPSNFLNGSFPVVQVSHAGEPPMYSGGILMRTTRDHRAFEDWFRPAINAKHEKELGMPDVFELEEVRGGYITDLIAADHEDMRRYMRLVRYFCLVSILMALLALLAMSTFYAGSNSKGIAVRKVFGSTIGNETRRGVLTYMLWVGISLAVAIPLAVYACDRFLQTYPEHITGYWWIFVLAALLTVALSFASVLWQTLKAARTDPAVELKKE